MLPRLIASSLFYGGCSCWAGLIALACPSDATVTLGGLTLLVSAGGVWLDARAACAEGR